MNKKIISLGLIACIMSLQPLAFASFSGHWEGVGQAKDSAGWSSSCKKISYTFVHNTDTLNVTGGEVKCGEYETTFDDATLKIEKGKLFYGDLEVGTITNDLLHVVFQDDPIYLSYSFSRKKDASDPGKYFIEYRQDESFGEGNLSVEGQLTRQAGHK